MVSCYDWDDWGSEPGFYETVIVGTHLCETLGILVDKRGFGNRVGTWEVLVDEESVFEIGFSDTLGFSGGVVGPVRRHGCVSDREEENLDGVGETNIVTLIGILERIE